MSQEDKETTRVCPSCGNTDLVLIGSHNYKYCTDCNLQIPWYVEEGQAAIHGGSPPRTE